MAPKKAPAAAAPPAKKTQQKKAANRDDDDDLLDQQLKVAEAAAKELAVAKAKEDAKKAELKKAEAAKVKAEEEAARKMPPISVNEVAVKIYEFVKARVPHMRDCCWTSYILHRFMMQAVEKHRRLVLTPQGASVDEPIVSFEVHDDKHPGDLHSWNVITTASGKMYCIDMSLEQFLPSGRHGYRRDTRDVEGYIPVEAPSRVLPAAQTDDTPAHVGETAIDAGVFPVGGATTDVALGVPAGSHAAYVKFITAANDGRHKAMTADERAIAEILQRNKAVPQWMELHAVLESTFLLSSSSSTAGDVKKN